MKTLNKILILASLLLLAACANQEQDQSKDQTTTQPAVQAPQKPVVQPSTVAQQPQEITLVEDKSAAGKPTASGEVKQADSYHGALQMKKEAVAPRAYVGNGYNAPAPAMAMAPAPAPYPSFSNPYPENREQYGKIEENPVKQVAESPVSTFSIDVDSGSYTNVRRILNEGRLPPADAVRVEEMINYFPYQYALPKGNAPFAVHTEIAPAPWNRNHQLLRIGIKGQDVAKNSLPAANLVFLVDVSGSMDSPERLPLLKSALKLLINQLRPQDHVSLVTYASGTRVVLEPTSGAQKAKIVAALQALVPGGSTNGAGGITLAYDMAQQGFIKGGINRILLATDGDFNVGITNFEALKNMVEEKRRVGVSLSTLGFGVGNYNDRLMEQLADAGNGSYSYIDTLNEGQKVLVNEMTSTLATIAKDVKIQVEFNPEVVSEYRLIGYENRMLKREDFNNDKVDAGDVGAGHTVTALYELTLKGQPGSVDPLRYGRDQNEVRPAAEGKSGELAFLRLRYKAPDGDVSKLAEWPLHRSDIKASFEQATGEFRFAVAVAAFGQQLRGGKHTGNLGYAEIARIASAARGEDAYGYRGEFLRLVQLAQSLSTGSRVEPIEAD